VDDATSIKAERKAPGLAMSLPQVVTNYLRDWAVEEEASEESRRLMTARFARPNWGFAVGTPDDREQRIKTTRGYAS
jgi:hypothetical protein